MKAIRLAVFSVAGAGVLGASLWVVALFKQPTFRIHEHGSDVELDMKWLGDYDTQISRLKVSERDTGRVVWEIRGLDPLITVSSITLKVGQNPSSPSVRSGGIVVVAPAHEDVFELKPTIPYRVEVWGESERWFSKRYVFTLAEHRPQI